MKKPTVKITAIRGIQLNSAYPEIGIFFGLPGYDSLRAHTHLKVSLGFGRVDIEASFEPMSASETAAFLKIQKIGVKLQEEIQAKWTIRDDKSRFLTDIVLDFFSPSEEALKDSFSPQYNFSREKCVAAEISERPKRLAEQAEFESRYAA